MIPPVRISQRQPEALFTSPSTSFGHYHAGGTREEFPGGGRMIIFGVPAVGLAALFALFLFSRQSGTSPDSKTAGHQVTSAAPSAAPAASPQPTTAASVVPSVAATPSGGGKS